MVIIVVGGTFGFFGVGFDGRIFIAPRSGSSNIGFPVLDLVFFSGFSRSSAIRDCCESVFVGLFCSDVIVSYH